jgi:copper transport protein
VVGLTAAGLLLAVVQAPQARAHAQLDHSVPADGVSLTSSPRELTLAMSEAVELDATRIFLTDGQGRPVPVGSPRVVPGVDGADAVGQVPAAEVDEPPMTLAVDLPALPADLYRVSWTTLSSDDLHGTSGVLVFGVRHAVPAAAASPGPADPPPSGIEIVLRWLGLLSISLAAGAAVLLLLLRRTVRGSPQAANGVPPSGADAWAGRLRNCVIAGTAAAALAGPGLLVAQATQARVAGGPVRAAVHLLDGWYGVRWGTGEAAVLLALWLAVRPGPGRRDASAGRMPAAVLVLAAGWSLATALLGHAGAGAARAPIRLALEAAHVGAAVIWIGTVLGGVVTAARTPPALRREVLRRFGVIAAACLGILVATGVVLAGRGVASVDAALGSTYGRLLLIKLVLVAVACGLAGVTAVTLHPGLPPARLGHRLGHGLAHGLGSRPDGRSGGRRLGSALGAEALAGVGVLLAAASMASSQPAVGRAWAPPAAVQPMVSGTAGDLVESLQISPNRPGRNFVTVDVFNSRRPAPAPIAAVQVALTGPSGNRDLAAATPQGEGRWVAATDLLVAPGTWSIDVLVSRPGYPTSAGHYRWVVADPANRAGPRVVSAAALRPWTDRLGIAAGTLLVLAGAAGALQARGRRRVTSAPPSGAPPADALPPPELATAATSASPNPFPGSSPGG